MFYLRSPFTDPFLNLSLEEYIFTNLAQKDDFFMFWQNSDVVVIGKHQNVYSEVNIGFAKENDIKIVRRNTGGGAVFHDLGNINFSFIVKQKEGELFDFSVFCIPMVNLLKEIGVNAYLKGRNDMEIDGQKFSGSSQFARGGKLLHHGTLMFNCDLEKAGKSLTPSKDKIKSKGTSSVKSRITNISQHIEGNMSKDEFLDMAEEYVFENFDNLVNYELSEEDIENVSRLAEEKYNTWEWNFGKSPEFEIKKQRYVDGVGYFECFMNIKAGVIEDIKFYGDYFFTKSSGDIEEIIKGSEYNESAVSSALENTQIGDYFHKLSKEELIKIITL